jgi:methionyl-tRNA synthetase
VATWGNLVNRVLSMIHKTCDGAVPALGELTDADRALWAAIDEGLETAAAQFDRVELRAALRTAMDGHRPPTST